MSVDFKITQAEFSAYIKDPFNNPKPSDINPQRIETYRELFFNNIDSFLSSNFPVLKTILTEQQWFELTQDFYAHHTCSTPYFSEIPEEFIDYLQHERKNTHDFPFLLELAHYEWVEMALSIAQEEISANPSHFIENIASATLRLSPLAWPLAYQFPVQQISPSHLPETAPSTATFLLVYRAIDDDVNFIKISPITFRLLQILQESDTVDCQHCLQQIAQESGYPQTDAIIASGLDTIKDLAGKNIILAG